MGYIISFIIGGMIGVSIMSIMFVVKDDREREALTKQLKDEIYEDIYSSKDHEDKE